jgi:ubiquinone/menaquinone biosynthesis C-methylase UbiE
MVEPVKKGIRKSLLKRFQRGQQVANWDHMPKLYLQWRLAKQLGEWDSAPRRAIRAEIARVGGSVLEVAVGPGIEYDGMQKAGMKVDYTGVDVTPAMVELCRKRFPGVTFLEADVKRLPFKDNQFDLVMAKDLLEHLDGYEAALGEMYRVARREVLVYFFLPLAAGQTVLATHPESGFRYNRYAAADVLGYARRLGAKSVDVTTIQDGATWGDLVRIQKD